MMHAAEAALVAARSLESAGPRAATVMAEQLVHALPEIFGGAGNKLAALIAHKPDEAMPVLKIVHDYQATLAKFGMTGNATVNELFRAARESGLELTAKSTARGTRSSYSSSELVLDNGFLLKSSGKSFRHSAEYTTAFLNGTADSELAYTLMRFRGSSPKHVWSIKTPSFSNYTERRGW